MYNKLKVKSKDYAIATCDIPLETLLVRTFLYTLFDFNEGELGNPLNEIGTNIYYNGKWYTPDKFEQEFILENPDIYEKDGFVVVVGKIGEVNKQTIESEFEILGIK